MERTQNWTYGSFDPDVLSDDCDQFSERWEVGNCSEGCVWKTQFACENGSDVFVKYPGLKLPDTRTSWFDQNMELDECQWARSFCGNCSLRISSRKYQLWKIEQIEYRCHCDHLCIRNSSCTLSRLMYFCPRREGRGEKAKVVLIHSLGTVRQGNTKLFDFKIIANATGNFSQNNKLGEGGFGPVYKGTLNENQEIAVKRLSKTSRQGLDEFKNEVSCIAKLQHRNLVRLLGCCIEDEEMLLIYEYMPNKSLDSFIFAKVLSKKLDWPKRNNIINGTDKGLQYLHQDSRLRIIHRDLKAGNILLDHDMSLRLKSSSSRVNSDGRL
ncbi:Non-specific serine/threonine protein kinase [Heracleum sosnowskyi]|uniref:non-specific serine/threonine protein kinase n=1 Tax=Heracleum sosnowskyi TaxID=360622 RepID=A0AAD8MLA4_9APIA|nr:Non-specific serine/threonine protein kinase [Heracleum sosnowskyi]